MWIHGFNVEEGEVVDVHSISTSDVLGDILGEVVALSNDKWNYWIVSTSISPQTAAEWINLYNIERINAQITICSGSIRYAKNVIFTPDSAETFGIDVIDFDEYSKSRRAEIYARNRISAYITRAKGASQFLIDDALMLNKSERVDLLEQLLDAVNELHANTSIALGEANAVV